MCTRSRGDWAHTGIRTRRSCPRASTPSVGVEVFARIFGKDARTLGLSVVYDVCHNTVKVERHVVDGKPELVVHRKGATRAFGPGEDDLPADYRATGQPVIIGGSMETGSAVVSLTPIGNIRARVVRRARKRRRTTARRGKPGAPKEATPASCVASRGPIPDAEDGMYRRILVAVDGSSTSEAALAAAVALARALSGRLRVLHVVDSPYDYPDVMYGRVPGDREELREAWHTAGQEVLGRAVAQARQGGCEPEACLIEGNDAHASQYIAEAARAWGADLIVIGTNGRRGLSRLLLGSVAEGVARAAAVPVLLVRQADSHAVKRRT